MMHAAFAIGEHISVQFVTISSSRTRGELDKARGEALQMRELSDDQRERVAQVEAQVRVALLVVQMLFQEQDLISVMLFHHWILSNSRKCFMNTVQTKNECTMLCI